MKVNGYITKIEFKPISDTKHWFTAEISGPCSPPQIQKFIEFQQNRGTVEIQEWDGVNPIFGIKITVTFIEDPSENKE